MRSKRLADSAWCGAVVAGVFLLARRPDLPTAALLLAALVIVPLGVQLILRQTTDRAAQRLLQIALRCSLPAALALVAASMVPVGSLSLVLTVPWIAVTAILAAAGLRRFVARAEKFTAAHQLAFDIGLVLIAIGGAWVGMWRWGAWPGSFPPVIAELTAVHFHFAGFALPIIAGHVVACLKSRLAETVVPVLAALTLLLAVGITWSPLLEVTTAVGVAWFAATAGILQLKVAFSETSQADVMSLLAFSAVALLCGMGLAMGYAVGEYVGSLQGREAYSGGGWLDVPTMIRLHGATLAFGYALIGMLAVSLGGGSPYRTTNNDG
ncbi:MAG: YndJ family transporter [Pirellulales bacterium]